MGVGRRALSHTSSPGAPASPTSASHAGIAASAMARRPRARSVGAGRRRADPTFGGTGFRWSAHRLAKQKCVQPVEQTGAHNGWRNRSLGIGTRWFTDSCFRRFETALRNQTGPPAMMPAGAQVHRYEGNRAPTHQRGSGRFLTQAPPGTPYFPSALLSPQRLGAALGGHGRLPRVPRPCVCGGACPQRGQGAGEGAREGAHPGGLGATPFSMAFRIA